MDLKHMWDEVNNSRIIAGIIPAFIAALSVYFTWKSYKSSHEATHPALLRLEKWVDVYKKIKDNKVFEYDKDLEDTFILHKDAALWETKVFKNTYPGRIREILLEQNFLSPYRERELLWFPIWKFQKLKMIVTMFLILVLIISHPNDLSVLVFIAVFFVFDAVMSWVSMYRVANRYYKSFEHGKSEKGTRWLELYSLLFNGSWFVTNNINRKKAPGIFRASLKYLRMLSYYIFCVIFTNYVNIFSTCILIYIFLGGHPQEVIFAGISGIYVPIYIIAYSLSIKEIYYPDMIRFPHRNIMEAKIKGLGIKEIKEDDKEIFDQLLALTPKKYNDKYPKPLFGADYCFRNKGLLIIFSFSFPIFIIYFFVSLYTGNIAHLNTLEFFLLWTSIISIVWGSGLTLWFLGKQFFSTSVLMEKNIIFRNGYYALRGEYLSNSKNQPRENGKELEERKKFENTDVYKEWKKKNPELTSWNYGLSISRDNNPYKSNTGSLEPNHLPPSLFLGQETPKRQEP